MCDPSVLKPILIKTTGPLIRVAGDRFPSPVKAAILQTLSVLLDKGGSSLKAFAPQLQTTFVKSLTDPMKIVRLRAADCLGQLMPLTTRVDPLLSELASSFSAAESNSIKASILDAASKVLKEGGFKSTSLGLDKLKSTVLSALQDEDDAVKLSAANLCRAVSYFLEAAQVSDLLIDLSSQTSTQDPTILSGKILG